MNFSPSACTAVSVHLPGMTSLAQDFPISSKENLTFSGSNDNSYNLLFDSLSSKIDTLISTLLLLKLSFLVTIMFTSRIG